VTQLALLALLLLGFHALADNLWTNLHLAGINPGFGFLAHTASFQIGESVIPYEAGDSYARAIVVGLLNTVKIAIAGCVLATVLGVALGVARLSSNPLLSGSVQAYVELVRNTPLLLQLFFWSATLGALPGPRQAFAPLPGVLLSNRGIFIPGLNFEHGALFWDTPALHGFNITGGWSLSPEFAALLIGLVVNASASIAETVRGGILSVHHGQWEAGGALGLSRPTVLRRIVLPQALRVIVPVMTSSYLSLAKNSSLAVAIGFPDLVSVLNTTANSTGQALETIAIMMAVYLALSLAVSLLMNWYNRRWALKGNART